MIKENDMIKLLCEAYPGFRDRLCIRVDEWFCEDGSISLFQLLSVLADFVVERLGQGDYAQSDSLFEVVETLLLEGNEAVQTAISTGFLEDMQHQAELSGKLWVPLLGIKAKAHCLAMDEFHGATTAGLKMNTEQDTSADAD